MRLLCCSNCLWKMFNSQVHLLLPLIIIIRLSFSYVCSTPTLELKSIGSDRFRVSIPNDPDISWVTFHINFNKKFKSVEAGQLTQIIREPTGSQWSYEFQRRLGDTDDVYIRLAIRYETGRISHMLGPFKVRDIRSDIGDMEGFPTTNHIVETTMNKLESTTSTPVNPLPQSCLPSITKVDYNEKKQHCRGDLIFEEEFDKLDAQRWTNEVRLPLMSSGDYEFVVYNGTAFVDNGTLKIPATVYPDSIEKGTIDLGKRCTGITSDCSLTAKTHWYLPPVISGRINSKKAFNFKYGRIEVKAKMPKGDWLVPLILLEPNIKKYGEKDYKSGEMRIGFTRGNLDLKLNNIKIHGTRLYGGAVLSGDANSRHQFMANVTLDEVPGAGNEHFGNKFHVYSLIWKPNELLLSVDNYQYGKIKTDFKKSVGGSDWRLGGEDAPLDQMFYLTLGLSAGGHGDFPQDSENKPWLNTAPKAMLEFDSKRPEWHSSWKQPSLEVDYIRVYAV